MSNPVQEGSSTHLQPWSLTGSYFEACNCEAICPCRMVGGRAGSRSTYGHCDFAVSWKIHDGRAGPLSLSGLNVVMAGTWEDDRDRPSLRGHDLWGVALYVDDRASLDQFGALSAIFLGRAGGSTLVNFARAIAEVYTVRRAKVELEHTDGKQRIDVPTHVTVRAREPVLSEESVTCGVPGHDQPGQEWVADVLRVADDPLVWQVEGRCAFAASFAYASD